MHRTAPRPLPTLGLLLAALAACTEPTSAPMTRLPATPPVAALSCTVRVGSGEVECSGPVSSANRSLVPGGVLAASHITGGQGTYVRLAATSTYAGGVLTLTTTVQNLTAGPFATTDGATRDAGGVKVFLLADPVTTGGTGTVTVANADGTAMFTASGQSYFQYGGQIGGVDQPQLGADGILSSSEVSASRGWQFNLPASVTSFTFDAYVATETPSGAAQVSVAPQVTAVSTNPMVPGASVTLTGTNFNATPASNAVTIGGVAAAVTGATTTSLTVTVPCTASGTVPVNVTTGGMKGANYGAPLAVTQRTVAVGQALVLTSAAESECNELTSADGPARYIVAIFSDNTSPSSNSPMQFSADGAGAPAAGVAQANRVSDAELARDLDALRAPNMTILDVINDARQARRDAQHLQLLQENARMYEAGRATFGPRRPRANHDVVYLDPPATRQFRVSNISPPAGQTICSSFYVVNASRVYYNGKLAIYEDDATPAGLRSSDNASMASYYQKIGDQFNADMEPIIRTNFGDILRRDAETDNNGIEIALFTPRINNSFSGVAGFVVSCDQFPNNDTTTTPRAPGGPYTGLDASGATASFGASNFGENFYAYEPTINGTGFGTAGTPDYWYRTIRSTFIHESKHVASFSAHYANNAPFFEESWMEEGMARHSEELWMRNAVDNVPWKGNTGFGSLANPINVYCDLRTTAAECNANPRRPSVNMLRHFNPMYTEMFGQNARLLSPFGPTSSDTQSFFYAVSWSLIRYAVDRYGASDAAFLGAITQSTTTGVANLTARSGVSLDQILGGWALALAADDHPLLAAPPSADIQFPTWNMRSIYAGLNTDPNASGFTLAYPLVPTQLAFGSFTASAITTLRGGGALWYEISGTQTVPQLLRLKTNTGGAPSANLRLAVTRIQ